MSGVTGSGNRRGRTNGSCHRIGVAPRPAPHRTAPHGPGPDGPGRLTRRVTTGPSQGAVRHWVHARPSTDARGMDEMPITPLNLVLFSGTDDKLQAAAVLTAGAAALGTPVHIFLQYWALDAFRADRIERDHGLAPEAGAAGRAAVDALRAAGQASWAETLRQAKDLGEVDIQACSLSMDLLQLDRRRPRPARRRRRGRDRLLPQRRRRPDRLHLTRSGGAPMTLRDQPDGRRPRPLLPDADRQDRPGDQDARIGRPARGPRDRPGLRQGLRGLVAVDRQRARRADLGRRASTASSSAGSEASTMTLTTMRPDEAVEPAPATDAPSPACQTGRARGRGQAPRTS